MAKYTRSGQQSIFQSLICHELQLKISWTIFNQSLTLWSRRGYHYVGRCPQHCRSKSSLGWTMKYFLKWWALWAVTRYEHDQYQYPAMIHPHITISNPAVSIKMSFYIFQTSPGNRTIPRYFNIYILNTLSAGSQQDCAQLTPQPHIILLTDPFYFPFHISNIHKK